MSSQKGWIGQVGRVGMGLLCLPGSALACAVCYGDPGAPASKGLAWAVVSMVCIVGLVLSGVVAFFVHAVRHEKKTSALEPRQQEH
ncbi:MAG: hypothetical protein RMN51_06125 [Verrucomicrobiota bacterium]|nr:hypothetical protein [Limisphaera sp.]MDW8381667.1 hypothetical protein [Verrucomicrobiota bacterium]